MTELQAAPLTMEFVGRRRVRAIAAVLAAMTLVVLDAAMASVALSTIGHALHIAPAAAVRIITAYQLGLVVALFPAAALGESLGYHRVFTGGAALFTGAAAACALSPSMACLLAARFVQGCGGAAIMALGIALLRFTVPQDQLGRAIGWNALAVALSSAAGPALGAAIVSVAPWQWLFAVSVPIGLGVLALVKALPVVGGTGRRVDLLSVGISALASTTLIAAAQWLPSNAMMSSALLIIAVLTATMLLRREATSPSPLIPFDLLRQHAFRASILASILCFAGQGAGLIALPFYMQRAFGLSPLAAGLILIPWPLAVAIAGPMAGRLANHLPTACLCLAGGICLSSGLGLAAIWPSQNQPLAFCICTAICGLGFGLFNVPNNRKIFMSAPQERSAAAGSLQGMARLTGQMVGAAMIGLLFELSPASLAPRIGLAFGAVMTLAAGLASMSPITTRSAAGPAIR